MSDTATPLKAEFPTLPRRDLLVAGAAVVVVFVVFFITALRRAHHALLSYDMAYFSQVAWYIRHGDAPYSTLRGLPLLGDHANYIMWPIGWLTAIFPTHQFLLFLQSGSIALTAGLIYLLARRVAKLGRLLSGGVTLSFALFPAAHNFNVADFHPEVIALPALVGAVYFAMIKRWWAYVPLVLVALACKEDVAIATALLGPALFVSNRKRAGVITTVVSLIVLAVNLAIVLPHFGGDAYAQAAKFGSFGDSTTEIIATIIRHPRTVLLYLTESTNLVTLLALFGPVLFLCWLAPRWLIPGIPGQILYMLSTVDPAHTIDYHYNVVITAFIFVAVVMALGKRKWPSRDLFTILTLSGLLFWWTYALDATTWFKSHPDFAVSPVPAAIRGAATTLRPDDVVLATDRMTQIASDRRTLYPFITFLNGGYQPPDTSVTQEQRRASVSVVMVDVVGSWQWNKDMETQLNDFLAEGNWTKVYDTDGVLVYRRT